jgi:hypothetical protein
MLIGTSSSSRASGKQTAANYLTISAIGRVAKQPELKYCAVRLAPAPDAPQPEPAFGRTVRRERPLRPIVVEPGRTSVGTT